MLGSEVRPYYFVYSYCARFKFVLLHNLLIFCMWVIMETKSEGLKCLLFFDEKLIESKINEFQSKRGIFNEAYSFYIRNVIFSLGLRCFMDVDYSSNLNG